MGDLVGWVGEVLVKMDVLVFGVEGAETQFSRPLHGVSNQYKTSQENNQTHQALTSTTVSAHVTVAEGRSEANGPSTSSSENVRDVFRPQEVKTEQL